MPATQVENRLVVHPQALLGDGSAQHPLGPEPSDSRRAQVLVEDLHPVPASVLRPVQREVGLLQQAFGAVVGICGCRDAHAHRAHELLLADAEGFPARLDDAVPQLACCFLVGDALGHDHELVAPHASEGVRGTDEPQEPLDHRLEHTIAQAVTEGVVDHLESVEVQEQHGKDARPTGLALERLVQPIHQNDAVGDASERIGHRLLLEDRLGALTLADVTHRGHHKRRSLPLDAAGRGLAPAIGAIRAAESICGQEGAVVVDRGLSGGAKRREVIRVDELFLVMALEPARVPSVPVSAFGRPDGGHVGRSGRQRVEVLGHIASALAPRIRRGQRSSILRQHPEVLAALTPPSLRAFLCFVH